MTMLDRRGPDDALDLRLEALAEEIAWPTIGPGMPAAVTARIAADGDARSPRPEPWWRPGRPARRGLVAAIVLLLVIVAVAAAVGLGLRGLRIVLEPEGSSPSVGPSRAGSLAGLGRPTELDAAGSSVGFAPRLPTALAAPEAAFVAGRRLTLLWPADADLPPIEATGFGLLLTQFRGAVDEGWYEKIVDSGAATVEPVTVAGRPGFWISGEPHQLVYRDPDGTFVEESRRLVGDVLVWDAGELTMRLESALGREAAIALAETIAAR